MHTSHPKSVSSTTLHPTNYTPSKRATYEFAIALIVLIGGLTAIGVGASGYFQVSGFSTFSQVQAITLIAGGTLFSLLGTVGIALDLSRSTDVQNGTIFGPKAWKTWGVNVLDWFVSVPNFDMTAIDPYFKEPYENNYILLYMPNRIRFKGKDQELNLSTLSTIFPKLRFGTNQIKTKFALSKARGGWILISKKVIPKSSGKSYTDQEMLLENLEYRLPHVTEACALALMLSTSTEEKPFGKTSPIYTRCHETYDSDTFPAVVGTEDEKVTVSYSISDHNIYGVLAVRKISN